MKKMFSVVSVAIIAGFCVGMTYSMHAINANRYFHYGMVRLPLITALESLNKWVGLFVVSFLLIAMCAYGLKFLWGRAGIRIHNKKIVYVLWALSGSSVLCYGAWSIYCYGLSFEANPVRAAFNLAVIAAAGLAAVEFLSNRQLLGKPGSGIQYPSATALVLLVLVLTGNAFLFVDRNYNVIRRPNVIFIIVDTLRADHVGCYGYSRTTTPNIDMLAEDSIVFKNAIATAPWTSASICSLITAQYPAKLRMADWAATIDDQSLLLSEILREHNYRTHGIISHIFIAGRFGFGQGFDGYDEANAQGEGHVSSPSVTRKATDYVRKNKDRPFFLFLHYFDPHYSYVQHEKYNYSPTYKGPQYSGMDWNNLMFRAPYMSGADVEYIKSLYDSEIAFTDEHIGRLIEELKALGLYEDALIVVTGDHGEEFVERGDHYIGHMRKVFQEMIHVPLVVKLPGKTQRRTVGSFVSLIDLMPSMLNALDLKIPAQYDHAGSIIDFDDPDSGPDRIIFSETRWELNFQAVIHQGWKLIQYPEMGIRMLFNLNEDPGEKQNLIDIHKERVRALEQALQSWNQDMSGGMSGGLPRKAAFSEEDKTKLKALGYLQ